MPFNGKSGKFNASINTVEFGCGDKAVKIGGENVLPLYTTVSYSDSLLELYALNSIGTTETTSQVNFLTSCKDGLYEKSALSAITLFPLLICKIIGL